MNADWFTRSISTRQLNDYLGTPPWTYRFAYLFTKRFFDIVVATGTLVLFAPVYLLIAVVIKMKSPGSVFFVQVRSGQNGKPFRCYKFRTMVPNAHWVLEQDDSLRASFAKEWKLVIDPRVTPIGRILRKTSLDELPQLVNIIKGDMSIVGPRPVQMDEMREQYGHHAEVVSSVRPGLTGLWQVSGRSTLTYEQRVAIDVLYVQRRTIWFDLLIILRTIPAIVMARGAH